MKKTTGFYVSVLCAILAAVSLALLFVYKSRGGVVANEVFLAAVVGILCEAASFFGEKGWTDFTSVGGAACLAFVTIKVLGDGIWNIAESINGIKMVGLPELAGMNYLLAGLGGAAVLLALIACFLRKSREITQA